MDLNFCTVILGHSYAVSQTFNDRFSNLKGTYKNLETTATKMSGKKIVSIADHNDLILETIDTANQVIDIAMELEYKVGVLHASQARLPSHLNYGTEMAKLDEKIKDVQNILSSLGISEELLIKAMELRHQAREEASKPDPTIKLPQPIGFKSNTSSPSAQKSDESSEENLAEFLSYLFSEPTAKSKKTIGFVNSEKESNTPSTPSPIGFVTTSQTSTQSNAHLDSPVVGFATEPASQEALVPALNAVGEFVALTQSVAEGAKKQKIGFSKIEE